MVVSRSCPAFWVPVEIPVWNNNKLVAYSFIVPETAHVCRETVL